MIKSRDSLDQHLALKACTLCVSTAQELVAHMYDNMGTSYWTSISHKIHCKTRLSMRFSIDLLIREQMRLPALWYWLLHVFAQC